MEAKDLLVADLEHFGESMWRNEEVGERRLTFFVSLLTAVSAGLVALAARRAELGDELFRTTATAAAATLLAIGLLSCLRMIHRNRVTDEYQRTLGYIRRRYVSMCPEVGEYEVPQGRRTWTATWLRGGYAETFAVFDGMLLVALLMLALRMHLLAATAAGVALTAVLWWGASRRSKAAVTPASDAPRPAQYFRAGVGALIVREDGGVLVLERSDVVGAWQLPQCGLENAEDPHSAVAREISEETGIGPDALRLVVRHPEPLAYELPPEARSAKTGRGQVQWWFVFEFRGRDEEIRLREGGEFRAWAWRPLDQIVADAADFRRAVYRRLEEFVAALGPSGQR